MKSKKGLAGIIAALSLSSVMASMAYSKAMVSNSVTTSIVSTEKALVSVIENGKFTDFAKVDSDGVMKLDFTKGGTSGFQPGSNYKFDDLFYIKNNIDVEVEIGLRFDQCYVGSDNLPAGLHTIETDRKVKTAPGGYEYALVHVNGEQFTGGVIEGRVITLKPGESVGIDWNFNNNYKLDDKKTHTLQIHAEAKR